MTPARHRVGDHHDLSRDSPDSRTFEDDFLSHQDVLRCALNSGLRYFAARHFTDTTLCRLHLAGTSDIEAMPPATFSPRLASMLSGWSAIEFMLPPIMA
jgi:hypothetical protein